MNQFYLLSDALNYIEAHLREEISQQEIADCCHCSLSSLQKLFRYTFHISVGDYVSRRRLTCCARELIQTDRSVLDIAMNWGYNSPEVFTRAFFRLWGEPPASFRKKHRFSGIFPKFELHYADETEENAMTEIHRKYVISELYDYLNSHRAAYIIAFDIHHMMAINAISRKAGDVAIREALRRIEAAAGPDMLLFRTGGDEFALATGLEDPAAAQQVMDAVLARNGESIQWEETDIPLSLYATKFLPPNHAIRYSELFSHLEQALDTAKRMD